MPAAAPKSEDELIVPARDGVLRVLRAAHGAKVKRVVLTSSCGAIYYGHPPQTTPFDETSWTNIGGEMSAYVRSKAIAERAAWDFIKGDCQALELSVINPAGIFGPVLGADFSSSIELVTRLMKGMPGCPRLHFGVVDVRDVADLHLRAMTHPAAKGERFIAVSGDIMSMLDIATVLKAQLGEAARKVPTRQLPNWLLRCVVRSKDAAAAPAAQQHASRDQREGRACARMETTVTGRRNRRHRRESRQVWNSVGGRSLIQPVPAPFAQANDKAIARRSRSRRVSGPSVLGMIVDRLVYHG